FAFFSTEATRTKRQTYSWMRGPSPRKAIKASPANLLDNLFRSTGQPWLDPGIFGLRARDEVSVFGIVGLCRHPTTLIPSVREAHRRGTHNFFARFKICSTLAGWGSK
ncbi:MAG TPA: hypothetical protein VH020_07555, partial [Stellaceae bacterium]|nr:hypothetical protein [Stellaceae bacterium]